MSDFPPEWRRAIIRAFCATGADDAAANEIVDLAVHAVDEALKTMSTVTNRGSTGAVRLSSLPLAMQLLRVRADAAYEHLAETFVEQGIRTSVVDIDAETAL